MTKRIYKAPETIDQIPKEVQTIFLAGSIEMDQAINWQKTCEDQLSKKYIVFNPRRATWDNSWKQSIENIEFRKQVNWELDALEKADIIIMFLANNTKSPISLLELGLYAKSNKLKVVVQEQFWRKGNVDILCKKYNIPQYKTLDQLLEELNKTAVL